MRKTLLCLMATTLLTLPLSSFAQTEIAAIPFETIPEGVDFVAGGQPIGMQADTAVTGQLSATGTVSSDTGFLFPDGSVQVTAGVAASGASANEGLYGNTIPDISPPNAYTEVCFKGGTFESDFHDGGESTAGGDCIPGDTGWIIERFVRTTATWTAAKAQCLMDGLRLPEPFEWQFSCDNAAEFALVGMTDAFEWSSNTASSQFITSSLGSVYASVMGGGSCARAGIAGLGLTSSDGRGSFPYRCVR